MTADPLPGMPDLPPPAPEVPKGSAGQRLTERQAQDVRDGRHPLTRGPLHPMAAPEVCTPGAPRNQPFTCGSCRFRELVRWHDKAYPKCLRDGYRVDQDGAALSARSMDNLVNVSHGAASDCRGWWPACRLYEAGDNDLSPDASRVIP